VEPGFEEPRPAVDTVEILPTPEVEESEQTLVEARASWADDIGAVAIETASLPALAGDGQASSGNDSGADEGEPGAARPVEVAVYEAPHPQPRPPAWLAMDVAGLRRLCSPLACTGDLRRACAFRRLSSRAVCNHCGLRRTSCIRLAADITLGLAPSCYILQSSCPVLPTAFAPSYSGQL